MKFIKGEKIFLGPIEFDKIKIDAQRYFKLLIYLSILLGAILVAIILMLVSLIISNRKIKQEIKKILNEPIKN